MEELTHYESTGVRTYFLSLTYDEDNVPRTPDNEKTLNKKKFLQWLKDTQKALGNFRYYAIGEYGDDTFRPHYHLALFPETDGQAYAVLNRWADKYGTIRQCDPLTLKRARYLANYTAKKLSKPNDARLKKHQEPEFRTSSRNPPLGAAFAEKLITHYSNPKAARLIKERGDIDRTFRVEGQIYPIGDWVLTKVRQELGIPVLHRDRIKANPNYLDYHETFEADVDPELGQRMERQLEAMQRRKRWRNHHGRL